MRIGYKVDEKKFNSSCDQKIKIQKNYSKEKKEALTLVPGDTKFEKFCWMRGIGYTETKIRAYLSISAEYFDEMDRRADEIAQNYLRYQAKTGHMQNLQMALTMQWNNALKLEKRANAITEAADKSPDDRKLAYAESHLRQTLNNSLETVYMLQQKVPLAMGFNKFVKENIVEPKERRSNKGRMALIPEQVQ